MITAAQCLKRYGPPTPGNEPRYMAMADLRAVSTVIPHVPRRVYCNRDLVAPLRHALGLVVAGGHEGQIRTWDGCFNVRKKTSGVSWSLHAWGLAVDINAAWNGYGRKPSMASGIVRAFKDAGFDWGGDWQVPDGMHFQLARFPG